MNPRALFLLAWSGAAAGLAASVPLSNPGFESGLEPWGRGAWRLQAAAVEFSADDRVRRAGIRSARIRNLRPNDSFLVQSVSVEPDTVYKISGWARTEGVSNTEGSIGANLSVQGTWIHSPDLRGTQPWRRLELLVRTDSGQTALALACRLGHWGSLAVGSAWFDEIALEKASAGELSSQAQPLRPLPPASGRSRSYWAAVLGLAAAFLALSWVLREPGKRR